MLRKCVIFITRIELFVTVKIRVSWSCSVVSPFSHSIPRSL